MDIQTKFTPFEKVFCPLLEGKIIEGYISNIHVVPVPKGNDRKQNELIILYCISQKPLPLGDGEKTDENYLGCYSDKNYIGRFTLHIFKTRDEAENEIKKRNNLSKEEKNKYQSEIRKIEKESRQKF